MHGDAEPEKGFYYRSDHFNFAKQGVPALDPDEGLEYIGKPADYGEKVRNEYTEHDYHQPSDVVKPNWDLSGAAEDLKVFLAVGYRVAESDALPRWKPGSEFKAKRRGRCSRNNATTKTRRHEGTTKKKRCGSCLLRASSCFRAFVVPARRKVDMATETLNKPMTGDEIVALSKKHTLFEWSAQAKVDPIPVARAKGIYFWTPEGKRFIDFNSQLMCVNIGHGDERVVRAIQEQAAVLAYANPFMATEARARLGAKLAEITPGDIDVFFFTNGGAEANENAIKLARMATGRHKILARYRSYPTARCRGQR